MTKINQIGEFQLLKKVVFPIIKGQYSGNIGDDAADVKFPDSKYDLVVTTDGPITPVIAEFGVDDYYYHGWYTILNNVSDLAAVGSIPICYTSSIKLPEDLEVSAVKRLFKGISDGCKEYDIKNAGGNLKNGQKVECHGTAIGYVKKGQKIGRGDCVPGDIVVSIGGTNGYFGHAFLKAKNIGFDKLSRDEKAVLGKPRAKVREMICLNAKRLISAASDNSDGVLGSLQNIADASGCSILLDMDPDSIAPIVKQTAIAHKIDPFNLFFFWGDWQVIATVKGKRWKYFEKFCLDNKIQFTKMGVVRKGRPAIFGRKGSRYAPMNILRNENFSPQSFNKDPKLNIDLLLKGKLFK